MPFHFNGSESLFPYMFFYQEKIRERGRKREHEDRISKYEKVFVADSVTTFPDSEKSIEMVV